MQLKCGIAEQKLVGLETAIGDRERELQTRQHQLRELESETQQLQMKEETRQQDYTKVLTQCVLIGV